MIKNTAQLIKNGATAADQKRRRDIIECLEAGLAAVEPYHLVKEHMQLRGEKLFVKNAGVFDLKKFKNIYVVGAGKAVCAMANAVEDVLRDRITAGAVNFPEMSGDCPRRIRFFHASHPIPGTTGMQGAKAIIKIVKQAGKNDLVLAIFSGGGSALMPLPADGITLAQKMKTTKLLLKTPATANELNVVRKHLSKIKGGQLACYAYPATMVALYISDVIDDSLDIQASGPTTPDPSTFSDAVHILKKYHIWNNVPDAVHKRFTAGIKGTISETPKKSSATFCNGKIHNVTIGNFHTAVTAAADKAKKLGYRVLPLTSSLQGEAEEAAKVIVSISKEIKRYKKPLAPPAMIIAGGETTVHLHGKGRGGRNQEFVLSGLTKLQSDMTLASLGTDGVDGFTPRPVAGALADISTLERALKKKMLPSNYLFNNDSYRFFAHLGEHLDTGGWTGTNVADLIILAVS